MNELKRQRILVSVLVGLLCVTAYWNHGRLRQSQAAVMSGRESLQDCRDAAQTIRMLRRRPAMAGSQEMQLTEITRRIEQAVQTAGASANDIMLIRSQPPRRVEDTVYKEKPTQVTLRQVTLQEVVRFLHELTGDDSGLRAGNLRLTAPRDQQTGDTWSVEVTLTYLIYAPQAGANGV